MKTLATMIAAGALLGASSAWAQPTPTPVEPAPPSATTPTTTPAPAGSTAGIATRQVTVDALEDMKLVSSSGTDLGKIDEVVESTSDKKQFVIVERGGVLGFFTTEVAIPIERFTVRGSELVLRDGNKAEIDAMPAFKNEGNAYRELEDSQTVSLAPQG